MTEGTATAKLDRRVVVVLLVLVIWRVAYHSMYLQDVPFSLATFSDGRAYELAARDLLEHPPLGTRPFYLQGIYAYFMAIPMAVGNGVALVLLAQLLLAGGTAYLFHRTAVHELGPRVGPWATVAFLAYPMLAFYENKFLTTELTICACVSMLAAASWLRRRGGVAPAVALGAAVGFGVLARPNLLLALPFAVWAVLVVARPRGKSLAGLALGLLVVLAPMAGRNLAVTGRPTVFPAHGGGTSFYIGNNASARGVWNTAGGLISGDVSRERTELLRELGIPESTEAEEAAAIGRALYARALDEMADDPGGWLWLEVRKVWLTIGSDELTQDYDLYGEQEMVPFNHRVGIPFGALLGLGVVGGILWRRQSRPVWLMLVGIAAATLAANLLYFTSSQHRLPLTVPAAFLLPTALLWLRAAVAKSRYVVVGAIVVAIGLTFIPRRKEHEPSAVHYYNVAIAWLSLNEPQPAAEALDRAVELRPDHPVIRLQRAQLLRAYGQYGRAREDLDHIDGLSDVPAWVRAAVAEERVRFGL